MLITPSPWISFNANGALADALVQDFGRAAMGATPALIPPEDYRLCLGIMEYGSAASVSVELFFAEQAGVTADQRYQIVLQTAQYFIWTPVTVPRSNDGRPYTLRITKAATNATLGYYYEWKAPGSC